jgi:hypothetical protein
VRSVGYGLAVIPPVYRTDATYGRLFKQPLSLLGVLVTELGEVYQRRVCTFVLSTEFVQQCLGLLEIRRVKPFGEPAVYIAE